MGTKSIRNEILQIALEKYGTEPEYLWAKSPGCAVLRHADNKKWYALIMDVQRNRLGLSGDGMIDILDIKVDPLLADLLHQKEGFLPAYHMNKENWITILLDGTVELKQIEDCLDMSFDMTDSKPRPNKSQD